MKGSFEYAAQGDKRKQDDSIEKVFPGVIRKTADLADWCNVE